LGERERRRSDGVPVSGAPVGGSTSAKWTWVSVWTAPLALRGRASGKGIRSGDYVYLQVQAGGRPYLLCYDSVRRDLVWKLPCLPDGITSQSRWYFIADLQEAEVLIAEKRVHLKELERERDYSLKRKAELDAEVSRREAEFDAESAALAAQVRAAYMSGKQERVRLLLNQRDPATLGRLLAYYGYLNDYRAGNIEAVRENLRELAALRGEVAAEAARIAGIAEAVCEALALGEKLNLPSERLLSIVRAGAAGSWFLEHRGRTMLESSFDGLIF